MPNKKAMETANSILDEWHAAGIPPVMHWRGCWYEYVDGTYYRRSAGWMVAKVRERVRPGLRASTCTALLCLSIQPDMQTFPPLPPGPGGRVQRKESN